MSGAPAGGITALSSGVPGLEAAPHRTRDGVSVVAEDVVRRFGDRVVLDHLRLQIAASEFVVLLGTSGCGKTTLLRLLAGLDRPDGGTVSVPAARAIVLQGARPLPWQRVWQNVIIGLYGHDARPAALSVLGEAGLSKRAGAWRPTAASAALHGRVDSNRLMGFPVNRFSRPGPRAGVLPRCRSPQRRGDKRYL
jgi:energy-coupling factor transporter ATP-binding protein EcfA2